MDNQTVDRRPKTCPTCGRSRTWDKASCQYCSNQEGHTVADTEPVKEAEAVKGCWSPRVGMLPSVDPELAVKLTEPTTHICLKHNVEYSSGACPSCEKERLNANCTYCGHRQDIHGPFACTYIDSEGPCDCKVPTDRIFTHSLAGHPAFYRHLERLRDLHSQKAQAYEGKSGYYANYRRFDKWSEVIAKHPKLAGFCYSMLRLEEKFERIRNILEGSVAGDEPIVENLDDMAVISVIARILYEEANAPRS